MRRIGLYGVMLLLFCSLFLNAADTSRPTYKVAVVEDFPPQYSLTEDGTPRGFAIDVIEELAKRAKFDIEYIKCHDWPEAFAALKSGRADLIPDQGITKRRMVDFAYSIPVETFSISIFTRSSDTAIHSKADLAGKVVGVIRLNAGEGVMKKEKGVKLQVFDHSQDAIFALLSGNIDAFVYPGPVGWRILADSGLSDKLKVVGGPLAEIERAVSVKKENKALLDAWNPVIREFIQSDEYRQIYLKWFAEPEPFWNARRVGWAMFAVVILIVLSMGIWRYLTVKFLNRQLTRSLELQQQAEKALAYANANLEQRVEERTREIKAAMAQVQTLSGLLPICSFCKRIRDDDGYWGQVEQYFADHANIEFSHSLCPTCLQEHYPKQYESMKKDGKV